MFIGIVCSKSVVILLAAINIMFSVCVHIASRAATTEAIRRLKATMLLMACKTRWREDLAVITKKMTLDPRHI